METCLVLINNLKRSYKRRLIFVLLLLLPALVVVFSNIVSEVKTPNIRIGVLTDQKDDLFVETIHTLKRTEGLSCDNASTSSIHTDLILGTYHYMIDLRTAKTVDEIELISYQKQVKNDEFLKQVKALLSKNDSIRSDLGIEKEDMISKTQRLFAFLLTLMIITSTINATSIILDKKNRTIQRYTYAPTSCFSYLLGNILFCILLSALQMVVTYVLMGLFHLTIQISIVDFIFLAFIMTLISTAIGIFVTCISDSELKANVFSSCIAVLFTLLGGAFVSYEKMPVALQKISVVSPVRWIIEAANHIEKGNGILKSSYPMIILSIGSCVLILASTIILLKRIKQ